MITYTIYKTKGIGKSWLSMINQLYQAAFIFFNRIVHTKIQGLYSTYLYLPPNHNMHYSTAEAFQKHHQGMFV